MIKLNRISLAAGFALMLGLLAAAPALFAANISRYSGTDCVEAATIQSCLNRTITSVNSGVSGILNANLTAVPTGTGTTEQTLQTFTMPANTISANAQTLNISCWGTTGATANNKTRKLYFGATSITTATEAANAQPWYLELQVMRTGAATQSIFGRGLAGTAGVTPVILVAQGTDDFTTALVIKCTGTDAVSAAADITANGMLVTASR